MDPAAMTIDELIADGETTGGGMFDRLAGITARVTGHGVTVTVNLDGQLVGLDLTDGALRLGPDRLAAVIHQLAGQAAGAAVAEGIAALRPVAGPELMELLVPEPEPEPAPTVEDFSKVDSWALRS